MRWLLRGQICWKASFSPCVVDANHGLYLIWSRLKKEKKKKLRFSLKKSWGKRSNNHPRCFKITVHFYCLLFKLETNNPPLKVTWFICKALVFKVEKGTVSITYMQLHLTLIFISYHKTHSFNITSFCHYRPALSFHPRLKYTTSTPGTAAVSIPRHVWCTVSTGSSSSLCFIRNGCTQRLICICINSWLPQPLYRSRQGIAFSSLDSHSSICGSCLCCYYFNSAHLPAAVAFLSVSSERDSLLYCGNCLIFVPPESG